MDTAVVQFNMIGDIWQNVTESKLDKKNDQERKSKDKDLLNTKLVEKREKSEKRRNHWKEERIVRLLQLDWN